MAKEWNDFAPRKVATSAYDDWAEAHRPHLTLQKRLERYAGFLPIFGEAAVVTLKVSVTAMLLAMAQGFLLAVIRVFGPKWASALAVAYIEAIRGTPVLIQLFFIFYGLPNVGIKLSPFLAGALGLGLNYAAYEAENYRAGSLRCPGDRWRRPWASP
jgi:polar amino acid transport system substrate-binding protein